MMAKITYHIEERPHPWKDGGDKIYCLCKKTKPEGMEDDPWACDYVPVAIFNLDSEARVFEKYLKESE